MTEINGWRGLQNLAERKTGRIVVSVAERWRCCSKLVTEHLWLLEIYCSLERIGTFSVPVVAKQEPAEVLTSVMPIRCLVRLAACQLLLLKTNQIF